MNKSLYVLLVLAVIAGAEDFEYSTAGSMGVVATTGGSATGWGEWFITSVQNNSGNDVILTQIAFPCCGDASDSYGWVIWENIGGMVAPAGNVTTCDYHGPYTPVDPGPGTFPPTVYTYVDISSESIIIPDGNYFCFGYDVTDTGGQISFNGVTTWGWYENTWEDDELYGRTAIIEIYGNFYTSLQRSTWGEIKSSF